MNSIILCDPNWDAKDGVEPANNDINPNNMIPAKYMGLRPIMSDNLPIGSRSTLMVKVSAKTIHWMVVNETSKSSAMVGKAIPTLP